MPSETAQRILSAANQLMVQRGYSAFSYADISDAVEIRKASIHHHFPTKADLAAAVLRAHREKLTEATDRLDHDIPSPLARLEAYAHFWEGCIRDQTIPFCVAALLAAELPSLPPEVQAEVRLHFQRLSAWVERTLEAGAATGTLHLQTSPAIEAQTFLAIIHGAMLSARATGACDLFQAVTSAALRRLVA